MRVWLVGGGGRLRASVLAFARRFGTRAQVTTFAQAGDARDALAEGATCDVAILDTQDGTWRHDEFVADLLRARRDVAVVATSSSAEEEAILRGLCGVAFAFKLEAEAMDLACRRFRITARERQVLAELCRGSSYRDISARLSIAEGTVQTHVKRIYEKLGVRSKLDALRVVRGQAPQGADRQNAQLGS